MAQVNTKIDFGKITLRKASVLQTVGTNVKYKVRAMVGAGVCIYEALHGSSF